MQSASQPRVRSACEPCHDRKQRCVIPDHGNVSNRLKVYEVVGDVKRIVADTEHIADLYPFRSLGGPCQSCQQASRSCFFVPRMKAGRPKRNESASGTTTSSSTDGQISPSPPLESSSGAQQRADYFSSAEHNVDPATTTTAPTFVGTMETENAFLAMDSYDSMNMIDVFGSSSSSSESNMAVTNSTMLDFTLPHPPPQDPILGLVERYSEMHRHEFLLRQGVPATPTLPNFRSYLLPTFIASIESACTLALSFTRVPSSNTDQDFATGALLLALVLKAVTLSDAVIHGVELQQHDYRINEYQGEYSQSVCCIDTDAALIFKQLDMSLAQAKHCLYQLGRQRQGNYISFATTENVARTRDMHARIGRLIDKVYEAQWN